MHHNCQRVMLDDTLGVICGFRDGKPIIRVDDVYLLPDQYVSFSPCEPFEGLSDNEIQILKSIAEECYDWAESVAGEAGEESSFLSSPSMTDGVMDHATDLLRERKFTTNWLDKRSRILRRALVETLQMEFSDNDFSNHVSWKDVIA